MSDFAASLVGSGVGRTKDWQPGRRRPLAAARATGQRVTTFSDRIRQGRTNAVERLVERASAEALCNGCFPGTQEGHPCR
jgi:hypothetical protein